MIVYLGRHPQTIGNVEKKIYGTTHYDYTALGELQKENLIRHCKKLEVNQVFASPLQRVATVAKAIGKEIQWCPELEEMHFGIFEGLTVEEVRAQRLDEYEQYMQSFASYEIPEGESFGNFKARIHRFIDKQLTSQTKHENILVLCHGMVIKEILEKLLALPEGSGWCIQVMPGALVQVEIKNGRGQLKCFGIGTDTIQ